MQVLHCVPQPAGVAHDRYSSISHTVHLVEAAGLYTRRHEQEVACGVQSVCQFFAVGDDRLDAVGMKVLQVAQLLFDAPFTGAQQDELDIVVVGGEVTYDRREHVSALFISQTTDEYIQRQRRVETQMGAQVFLVLAFEHIYTSLELHR